MKKRTIISAIALVIVIALALPALAMSTTRDATLTFRDIKIAVNGQTITPVDENGEIVEPFIIDGTTYLPVRAVADALGMEVDWDDETSTVTLGKAGGVVVPLDQLVFDRQHTMRTMNYSVPSTWVSSVSDTSHYFYAVSVGSPDGGYIRCALNASETDINSKTRAQTYFDNMYKDINSARGSGKVTKSELSQIDKNWHGRLSYSLTAGGSAESIISEVIMCNYNVYVLTLAAPLNESDGLAEAFEKLLETVSFVDAKEGSFTLSAGKYVVGEDIKAGKYDCTVVSGFGNLIGEVASVSAGLNELMGAPATPFEDNQSYRNLRLANKDEVTISGSLVIRFSSVS